MLANGIERFLEPPPIRELRFPKQLASSRPKRARPYLYSRKTSNASCRPLWRCRRYTRCNLRPWTYYCLFGLLSVSGFRLGEARNLKLADVDFDAAVLTIRGTKFRKSRLVPMHASTPQTTPRKNAIVTAIFNRLLHQSTLNTIRGDSYLLEKRRSGLCIRSERRLKLTRPQTSEGAVLQFVKVAIP
ncbi:tyrosine-type recombinase/integrase (plasmid) [Rhizobium sp. ZK1]|uniref:tyrosine-type recombinase/integrase n=1 Tax=Rhizobium sp. ZK1 TaxID=3389872 RepID=UPI0039F72E31